MSTTRDDILNELKVGHLGSTYWPDAQLELFIDSAIESLYPVWWTRKVESSTAGVGPVQTKPATAKNLHEVVLHDGRPRYLRGWSEGDTDAYIPYTTDISGKTLVWSWTAGFTKPGSGGAAIDLPLDARQAVLLMVRMSALQSLLTDKLSTDRHMAAQVRPNITEDEILGSIDNLSSQLRVLMENAIPRPEVRR